MVFYINARGKDTQEFIAENGEYIGVLGNKNEENISPADISLEKINKRYENEDKFLVCLILNDTWWVCILFNNADGAKEIKLKYKGKQMYWYWLERKYIQFCLPNIQYKEFEKLFPIYKS